GRAAAQIHGYGAAAAARRGGGLMGVDTRDVEAFAARLRGAPDRLAAEAKRVTSRGALNNKVEAQRRVRDVTSGPVRTQLPHYPREITDNWRKGRVWVRAQSGPENARLQGGMGRGVGFGSRRTPPFPHLFPALDGEEPAYVRYLLDAAEWALR